MLLPIVLYLHFFIVNSLYMYIPMGVLVVVGNSF